MLADIAGDAVLEAGEGPIIAGLAQPLHARFGKILIFVPKFRRRVDVFEARLGANEEAVKRIAVMDEKLTRIDKTVDEIRNNTKR